VCDSGKQLGSGRFFVKVGIRWGKKVLRDDTFRARGMKEAFESSVAERGGAGEK